MFKTFVHYFMFSSPNQVPFIRVANEFPSDLYSLSLFPSFSDQNKLPDILNLFQYKLPADLDPVSSELHSHPPMIETPRRHSGALQQLAVLADRRLNAAKFNQSAVMLQMSRP